jgi:hypothetical protein
MPWLPENWRLLSLAPTVVTLWSKAVSRAGSRNLTRHRFDPEQKDAQEAKLRPTLFSIGARGVGRIIARDIGGFCQTLRSRTAGIGTELFAPQRENRSDAQRLII